MHIKICGLTNLADALAAVEAGADYLGFNFYPRSPRYVTPEACARIVEALGERLAGVQTVGIFVNETPGRVRALLAACRLDLAQLHGEELPEALAALNGRAYKAFRGVGYLHADFASAGSGAPAFLVDAAPAVAPAAAPQTYGGTGRLADWAAARALAAHYPVFLAGGLTPANVAEAVAQVRPWGVDVASGVEASPGKKDRAKLQAFVQAAIQNPESEI
jgi:phosphoribosylanthranilate isomerase